MSELLNFLLAVAIILIAAKASGYVSVRLGQPSVLGELLVGLLLGPTVLNMLSSVTWFAEDTHLAESLSLFAEIGVLLLMFLAGLELDLKDLLRSGRVAALAGSLGVIIPLAGGYFTALLFGLGSTEAIFVGLALSATSVSISAQTLMELGVLRSKVGLGLLGAAVFDDVLVVLLLSAATVIFGIGGDGSGSLVIILIRMVAFLVGATVVGFFFLPPLLRRISDLPISQGVTVFGLVACLLFAWSSEALGGVAAITGAFMAGLFLARSPLVGRIEEGISAMAYGFFVPIFLVNIGLQADLRAVSGNLWIFAIVLTLVAVITKIVGSGGGALLAGFNRRDSLRLGLGMVSRGEVGLIVASVALSESVIQRESFSVLVFMIIMATVITPLMLRLAYREADANVISETDDKSPTHGELS
ncbi:MAG: cation:proton antiporter [Anaerolineales bacterium]|uniref:cation:proton antiporter n=1 Tax=Promineifilum sp. TaxID=2664178 RepID=UPI001D8FAA06|nr:cation:proton antiporter [Anaerolineales bacterium]MCO5179482.1 cation:proton antiporter [Promineifilum sp.]